MIAGRHRYILFLHVAEECIPYASQAMLRHGLRMRYPWVCTLREKTRDEHKFLVGITIRIKLKCLLRLENLAQLLLFSTFLTITRDNVDNACLSPDSFSCVLISTFARKHSRCLNELRRLVQVYEKFTARVRITRIDRVSRLSNKWGIVEDI